MIEYTVEVYDNGTKYWYLNGMLHREDGPAVEVEWGDNYGVKKWYLNNKLHREDGPAVEWDDGDREWFINNEQLTEEEFNKRIGKHKIIIDGKEIEISSESYENLRKSLQ